MNSSTLIQKVLDGTATQEEAEVLNMLLDQDSSLRAEYEDMKLFYSFPGDNDPPPPGFFEKIKETYYRRRKRKVVLRRVGWSATVLIIMASVLAWHALPTRTSDLVFVNERIATIVEVLELEYDINIEVNNAALLQCRFTGSFLHVSSAEEVLPFLLVPTKAEIQRTGERFIIKGGDCF